MTTRMTMNTGEADALNRDTLPTQVLNKLMDWIMDGTLKMGEKLNTEELARQLKVSRMPIREALKSLEKKGLAESVPYVGTRLITLTQDDILQVYLMRRMLEPLVAAQSCAKTEKEDIEELEKIHEEYVRALLAEELDAKKVYLLNRKFHFTIYSISEMNMICHTIESLWDTLSFFKLIYGRELVNNREKADKMIVEHQSYIDYLKAGDEEALKKSLEKNLDGRIEGIKKKTDFYTV